MNEKDREILNEIKGKAQVVVAHEFQSADPYEMNFMFDSGSDVTIRGGTAQELRQRILEYDSAFGTDLFERTTNATYSER